MTCQICCLTQQCESTGEERKKKKDHYTPLNITRAAPIKRSHRAASNTIMDGSLTPFKVATPYAIM